MACGRAARADLTGAASTPVFFVVFQTALELTARLA
jgi:hypothetical protein